MYDKYTYHPYRHLTGAGVALITPFLENGQVDSASLSRLTEHIVSGGCDFVVLLGTTGESPTVVYPERLLLIDVVRRTIDGRCPLVIGVGSNNTQDLCQRMSDPNYDNVDAILSVVPYYNKPTQEGLYLHFMAVAEASKKPIILYNIPSRTGCDLQPETVARLQRDSAKIIGIKEASGHVERIGQIRELCRPDLLVYSGDDHLTKDIIRAGGDGVVSVVANAYPQAIKALVSALITEQREQADEIDALFTEMYQLLFKEGNPVGIKGLLHTIHLIETSAVRLPLCHATEQLTSHLRAAHEELLAPLQQLGIEPKL